MQPPAGRNVEFEDKMLPLFSSWAFALAYCAFSFGMLWFGLKSREFFFILVTGFFAAWGPVYLFVTMRATLDARRFGGMRLRTVAPPATVGGRLSASLRISETAAVRGQVRAELRCNQLSFDAGRNRNEETCWAEERRFPIVQGAGGSYALISFDLPDGVPPSEAPPPTGGLEAGRKYGRWELQAIAESEGSYRDELYPLQVLPAQPGQAPSKALPVEIPPEVVQEETQALPPPPKAPEALSAWALVLANLVPVAGVAFWGWRVHEVVFLYWLENLVIGAFNILRIAAAEPKLAAGLAGGSLAGAKLGLIGFFTVHYGGFCYIHGEILAGLFPAARGGLERGLGGAMLEILRDPVGMAALLAIVASHGVSFFRNYLGRGEYQGADAAEMMMRPYKRIVVTHLFLIAGGFLLLALKSPVFAIVLFVALKIGFDVYHHRRERAAERSSA